MPILCNSHLHSDNSGDCHYPISMMIEAGIAAGLDTLCFTEHNDFNYPVYPDLPADTFLLNADSYLYELLQMREIFGDKIRLLYGVELGMQPSVMRENAIFAKSHEFDFVLGSLHLVRGEDPYYPETFEGRETSEIYRHYFEDTLECVKKHSYFDVLGHMDYVFRYGKKENPDPDPAPYMDIIEQILKTLIDKEKGLEVNTKSAAYQMKEFHPGRQILKLYKELGGEIVTVGTDAHDPKYVASDLDRAGEVLKECGFDYYAVFEKRTPEFHRI